jgi:hypothetical protein
MGQCLVHLPLVEESFLRLEGPGENNPDEFAVGPIDAEDSDAAYGHAEVKKPGLHGEPWGIRQEPNGERVFKRFFDFSLRQRAFGIKRRIIPIKLHRFELYMNLPCNVVTMYLRMADHKSQQF